MEDTKELYTALLGIRHPWRVDKVELNLSKNRVDVWIKEIKGLHWKCPVCRRSGALYDHDQERSWRHLDTCQWQTIIHDGCPGLTVRSMAFWATSLLNPMVKAAKTLKSHLPNILTFFKHRITNALAEGLNSKIQMVKQMSCGFRNREHYKKAIYFHCGGLDLYPRLEPYTP
jgi:hypothetical protein